MLSLLNNVQNATITESSKTEQSTVNNLKSFFPGLLHNKIIWEFIKICLPKFDTFNALNGTSAL